VAEEGPVKLLTKFNLVLVVVFGMGMYLISHNAYSFLMDNAKEQVIAQAKLMEASGSAIFNYNERQVSPILGRMPEQGNHFLPQSIPFYAVNSTFKYMRSSYPNYELRETAMNPLNLDNRATDWEADLIYYFRNHPGRTEHWGERNTPVGPMLYVAQAMVNDSSCLECHGQPSDAPAAMVQYYGRDHGYGWKVNEVSGAEIVSVPMSVPIAMAHRGFRNLLIGLGAIFLLTVSLIDIAIYLIVIRPLQRVANNADIISRGEIDLPQLEVKGRDEISEVTASFNRMHTSLIKAFEMLNG
jgi:HAMP domain-containing protein